MPTAPEHLDLGIEQPLGAAIWPWLRDRSGRLLSGVVYYGVYEGQKDMEVIDTDGDL